MLLYILIESSNTTAVYIILTLTVRSNQKNTDTSFIKALLLIKQI